MSSPPAVHRYLMLALTHALSCSGDACSECMNIKRTVGSRRFREAYKERRHPLRMSESVRAERAQVLRKAREAALLAARARVRPVLAVVAERYVVDEDLIRSLSREHLVTHARSVAMYLAHVELGMSAAEVGRALGRDHTTVLDALKKPKVVEDAKGLVDEVRRRHQTAV